ncbi:hypothetical protein OG562_19420 [Streptomyces sp. NBC_01275]|uniref:hypothetical protein n=1 Tax=Streptomyces sp. NBC_01275 TaxID=2903807 RepID=UPI002251CCEE|nr:hypothetical protein [Streptomyces sp. NBC_01275]MCX4763110.1 hypothetical protein [Streptomyces sp. NBC_01275]
MEEKEETHRSHGVGRVRRLSVAVAGAATLVALSVGAALAAGSDEDRSLPIAATTDQSDPPVPADSGGVAGGDSGSSTGGDGGSVDGGSSGGLIVGSTVDGGTTGGEDPDPTQTPTATPTAQPDLAELGRRIDELDAKVDKLPTKEELADALRAFADQLDPAPAPTPS